MKFAYTEQIIGRKRVSKTMKWMRISNTTEIEPNAFKLIGACTKRGSDKIGYFGSGLKYAMAVFMREGIELRIFSGKREVKVGLTKDTLRGREFDVITLNGEKTNMTTEMGPQWQLWAAVREVYCNALDEPDSSCKVVYEVKPVKGVTSFYIKIDGNEQLEAIVTNWYRYFSTGRVAVAEDERYQMFDPCDEHISVYRRGVRCYRNSEGEKSLFDYNFNDIEITESREVRYRFKMMEYIGSAWKALATTEMIDRLMASYLGSDYIEHAADWRSSVMFNPHWEEYVEAHVFVPRKLSGWFSELATSDTVYVPMSLLDAIMKQYGKKVRTPLNKLDIYEEYVTVNPDKRQEYLLKSVMDFYREVGIEIKWPILVGHFSNPKMLGRAHEGSVIISAKVFDMGRKKLAAVIIEEAMHLESMAGDGTREYQNYIINQMLTMLENKHGVFL